MNFGRALAALKDGRRVKRRGWNGKDQWVFLIKGTSLQSVLGYGFGEYLNELTIVDVLAIKTTSNHIQIGWLASQSDMLCEDWEIV